MGLVARAADDGSIPDITDPWPVKDVSCCESWKHIGPQTDCSRLSMLPLLAVSCWLLSSNGSSGLLRFCTASSRSSKRPRQSVSASCPSSLVSCSSSSGKSFTLPPCLGKQANKQTVLFSCQSWSSPCLCLPKSQSTFLRIWLISCNGSPSGLLLVF